MGYAVNEAGVEGLNNLAQRLSQSEKQIYEACKQIISIVQGCSQGIGPHAGSILCCVEEIYHDIESTSEALEELRSKTKKQAKNYQDIISNDPFSDAPTTPVVDGGTAVTSADGMISGGTQTTHREYITSYQQQVEAVQKDVLDGSGRTISFEEARKMLYGIQSFTGTASTRIRKAYNDPNADSKDVEMMKNIDEYLKSSKKWKGRVYRGINVTEDVASQILSGEPIDMLGPASWSSELNVAERFSEGYKDVHIVFVLDENKSGVSITHIGTYGGAESEVFAPSGIKYIFDGAKKVRRNRSDIIFIDVHE